MTILARELAAADGAQILPLHPSAGHGMGSESIAAELPQAAARWDDARLAACLLALDPVGLGGIHLIAPPGEVRDQWVAHLERCVTAGAQPKPLRRLPLHADDSRLIGGLDLTATLSAGRPVLQAGLLAGLDDQILLCAMAERMPRRTVSVLAQALDERQVRIEREGISRTLSCRFALVALDESDRHADEAPIETCLSERLAFRIDLTGLDWRAVGLEPLATQGQPEGQDTEGWHEDTLPSPDEWAQVREALPAITVPDAVVGALVEAAAALGIESMRAAWWAVQAARALAALRGLDSPGQAEVVDAARLVLGPMARRLPSSPSEPDATPPEEAAADTQAPPPPPAPPPDAPPPDLSADAAEPPPQSTEPPPEAPEPLQPPEPPEPPANADPLKDLTVAAIAAALPAGLLALMARQQGLSPSGRARGRTPAASRAGERSRQGVRGRPIGVRPGSPEHGHRLSLIDTLRQAAPWQGLRRAQHAGAQRILVAREDLRIIMREPRRPTTTVFVVDASGSNALNRLAEAKGAVETLLADCYVRRDRVAVLGFRGQTAETLLPPTRSLVRAKRSLAGLPGGGGTPMARALVEARLMCEGLSRRGETVSLVFLTDGKANITLEGRPGREQAHADAIQAARNLAVCGIRCLLVDTSPKPQPQARELALAMSARYLPLPQARTGEIGRIVRNSLAA